MSTEKVRNILMSILMMFLCPESLGVGIIFNSLSSQASWRWRSSSVEPGSIPISWKCSPRWWIFPTSLRSSSRVKRRNPSNERSSVVKRDWACVRKSHLELHRMNWINLMEQPHANKMSLHMSPKGSGETTSSRCLCSYREESHNEERTMILRKFPWWEGWNQVRNPLHDLL